MAFKIGIIGAGHMSERMADTIRQMPEAELYAVASREEEKAKAFAVKYGATTYYGSYEALMEDDAVQLIYIATPNHLHYEQARACIRHGKPVLLEKPFALNERQAQALIDLAEMHQVFLCEAMWVRFMPLMVRLQKDLEQGRIGEVTSVTADIGYDLKEKERVNRLDMGGGALLDIGLYPITFALQILGKEIDNISTSMVRMNSGVDAQEVVNLVYMNGAMASLYATMLSNTDRQGKIYGTEGYILVEDINNYARYQIFDAKGNLVETVERPAQISGLEYEVQACIHAIQSKKLECPQMTHVDTLFLMRVLDTVRRTWDMRFPQEETV
ncbi:MAG: Gfo/Idh/MocA family oxidoreductase [Lachnospiraceae bacterium]|nr:Gfo/Idh/MocA family oxidoreductase [Lachnospiraceae bacterium]